MTVEQFQAIMNRQPFQPFTIHMADGRKFDVLHPDFIARSQTGRTVVVSNPDDTISILDLLLMTEVQMHAISPKRNSGNN